MIDKFWALIAWCFVLLWVRHLGWNNPNRIFLFNLNVSSNLRYISGSGCIVISYFDNLYELWFWHFHCREDTDGLADFPSSGLSAKELVTNQSSLRKDATPVPQPASLPAKYTAYNMSSSLQRDMLPNDLRHSDLKASLLSSEDDFRFRSLSKPDGFDSLESIVRIKEAEARMFQTKADEARREAEEYHRVIRVTMEKMEGEYAEKLTKLRLQETEERRRKKLEELKVLENSHCDYYKMKIRMQAEITGLLERMEATKQQWV